MFWNKITELHYDVFWFLTGASVIQVIATDADDPTYGYSARVVYSILQGQPYFSVESDTGQRLFFINLFLEFTSK